MIVLSLVEMNFPYPTNAVVSQQLPPPAVVAAHDWNCGMNSEKMGSIDSEKTQLSCDAFGLSKSVTFLGKQTNVEHDSSIPGFQECDCRAARTALDSIRASGGRCGQAHSKF